MKQIKEEYKSKTNLCRSVRGGGGGGGRRGRGGEGEEEKGEGRRGRREREEEEDAFLEKNTVVPNYVLIPTQ